MTRPKVRRASARVRQEAEVRRLLARLGAGGWIAFDGKGGFLLQDQGTNTNVPVPARIIEACVAEDWLVQQGEGLMLTEAARARLRRASAGSEPFREQHQLRETTLREINGVRRQVSVNDGESPLGWLRSRKDRNGQPLIGDAQFEAGERLRADYWFAHLSPRVTANWSALAPADRFRRAAPSNAAALRDEVLAAKERVIRALMAVGPETSGILVDICCELKGLEEAEKTNGWPQRAGKVVLQIALTRLGKHYGLIAADKPPRRGLRHWGEPDYRPRIDGAAGDETDDNELGSGKA
jgi:uncharacterized protein DUF6456